MAVMAPDTSTDKRLDDLNRKIDEGFRESREEIRQLRSEINTRFNTADQRLNAYDVRFDTTQHMIVRYAAGLFGTMLIGFLSVIVAVLATHS